MAEITIGRVIHLNSRNVWTELNEFARSGEIISDEAAATIASWFQTPTGHGLTFATLSSTGRANPQDLIDACDSEQRTGGYDATALKALKVFAQSYQ